VWDRHLGIGPHLIAAEQNSTMLGPIRLPGDTMRPDATTDVDDVLETLATIHDEQRSLILDFARMLRA
jgi:hypothetical protein